jgi:hypothetical protein
MLARTEFLLISISGVGLRKTVVRQQIRLDGQVMLFAKPADQCYRLATKDCHLALGIAAWSKARHWACCQVS